MAVAHKLALLIHWVVVNQKPYIDKGKLFKTPISERWGSRFV